MSDVVSGLELRDLSVHYGTKAAVADVNLALEVGQILALVGPSGCGKSTLLRAVAGLVEPSAGSIRWLGRDLTNVATHQRGVGLMFQDHALFTHRTVAENIGFGLKMTGADVATRTARVDELLALVGLDNFGRRPIEGLSGGEAQRVALARALAPEPGLLLLDEPLASLDRARRVELNVELGRLLRELEQTAIYVTHDQDEAFAVADLVGVMHQGRLLRLGTPAEVWRDPQSEMVARFVGHETIIELGGQRFAVRPDALQLSSAGEQGATDGGHQGGGHQGGGYRGMVTSCAFQGDRFELLVEVEGQSWRLFHDDAVPVGSSVALTLDLAKLAPLHG